MSSSRELPIFDPNSWVWRCKKDAKFAVVIDTTKGIVRDVARSTSPQDLRNDLGLADDEPTSCLTGQKRGFGCRVLEAGTFSKSFVFMREFSVPLVFHVSKKGMLPD